MLFRKKPQPLKDKIMISDKKKDLKQEIIKIKNNNSNNNKKQKFRFLLYVLFLIIFIMVGFFSYKVLLNKIQNKSFVKEEPFTEPQKIVENPNIEYNPQKEMNDFFGKPVQMDNKGKTKIDMKFTYNIYERTNPTYINNYGNVKDAISCYKDKIKNNKGEKVTKDIVDIRYRDLNITKIKINQKIDVLEVIITTDKDKDVSKTNYYEMKIAMDDFLDKDIHRIVFIKDDLELLNADVNIK